MPCKLPHIFGRLGSAPPCAGNVAARSGAGRPVESEMQNLFDTLCQKLEGFGCELYTLEDLQEQMQALSGDHDKV